MSCLGNIEVWDYLKEFTKYIVPWLSAGAASFALYFNVKPKYEAYKNKKEKQERMNRFFHDEDESLTGVKKRENIKDGSVKLKVINFKKGLKSIQDYKNGYELKFYKYQYVFFNDCETLSINGTEIPIGYNLFEIISNKCIRLDVIDDNNGDKKSAFLYYENNIELYNAYPIYEMGRFEKLNYEENKENVKSFNTIIQWK